MKNGQHLIFVRHSLPEIKEGVPARDWKLSVDGRLLAEKLAAKLKEYHPDVLISSSEPKAKETAEIIGKNLKMEVIILNGLHEHDRSNSPYYSKNEFQNLVKEFFDQKDKLIFGRETAEQALTRFQNSVDSIMTSYLGKNILFVSHGTVMSLYISWFTGENGYDLWKKLGMPCVVELDVQMKTLQKIENIN